jgi:hypothetical protein
MRWATRAEVPGSRHDARPAGVASWARAAERIMCLVAGDRGAVLAGSRAGRFGVESRDRLTGPGHAGGAAETKLDDQATQTQVRKVPRIPNHVTSTARRVRLTGNAATIEHDRT